MEWFHQGERMRAVALNVSLANNVQVSQRTSNRATTNSTWRPTWTLLLLTASSTTSAFQTSHYLRWWYSASLPMEARSVDLTSEAILRHWLCWRLPARRIFTQWSRRLISQRRDASKLSRRSRRMMFDTVLLLTRFKKAFGTAREADYEQWIH